MAVLLRVDNRSSLPVARRLEAWTRELLEHVPREHLVGLSGIFLVDELSDRHLRAKRSLAMYVPPSSAGEARVELAVGALMSRMPASMILLRFPARFKVAQTVFHEIGHHLEYQRRRKAGHAQETSADDYARQILRVAFRKELRLLAPFRSLIAWLGNRLRSAGRA